MQSISYQTVLPDESGQRLDNYLIRYLKGVPRSHIYRIIRHGEVRVNQKRAKPCLKLMEADRIRIPPIRIASRSETQQPIGQGLSQFLSHQIIAENDGFIVFNKPAGLAVHGGSGLSLGVIEALRQMRPQASMLELVHRLDKETSGCLLIAKKRSVLTALQALFHDKKITKIYWALVAGHLKRPKTVDAPLLKKIIGENERKVFIHPLGKSSQTTFKPLEHFKTHTLLEALPKTGRTHQIRVHAQSLGYPLIGDDKYNEHAFDLSLPHRLYLHAHSIRFTLNNIAYAFTAPLDDKFTQTLHLLRQI